MIPIGVTARNEARNILPLLDSLRVAVDRASAELGCDFQIHVLLNDNLDETPRLLAGQPEIIVWNTHGGIVEAQRALAGRYGGSAPFLVFSDADILVEPNALVAVCRAMLDDPALEVAYAGKSPILPLRRNLLARALYFYNLREGYQTTRHYLNGQFFAIRRWNIPEPSTLRWDPRADSPFLNLAAGIRCDDIYLSRDLLRRGPGVICCVPATIHYRPPETLRGMFRKYQRMRLEIERLHRFFPESAPVHRRWGRRKLDRSRLAEAPPSEWCFYALFQLALVLCKLAYHAQRIRYTHFSRKPCPTWLPVSETKERMS